MQSFMKKCQEISFQVLSCFALGLGFEEDFFTQVRFHVASVDLLQVYAFSGFMATHGVQICKQSVGSPRA